MIWLLKLAVQRVVKTPPQRGQSADWLRKKADVLLSMAESWEKHQAREVI